MTSYDNRLTAYSDDEFFGRTYTYDGEHVFIKYYPYYAVNGSRMKSGRSIFHSVKQGDGGIWCVGAGVTSTATSIQYFPDGDGVPSEYYAALQRGRRPTSGPSI